MASLARQLIAKTMSILNNHLSVMLVYVSRVSRFLCALKFK